MAALSLLGARSRPKPPPQPVAFDHWQHVSKEEGPKLNCSDCHEHADKSPHATIPNVNSCMVCHETIKPDSPEVQKLRAYAERGQQPPWNRIYWFEPSANVYFSHKPHARAGISCSECHGDVAQMHAISRQIEQNMGWCIACHEQKKVSTDCYICHR
jgi:c(7)-type cytochrome triheme protein